MHPAYFPVFFWGLFIFASFLGFGETLRRALKRSEFEDLGWGLTAVWGMAVSLAIGGFLMAFKLAIAPILTAVIVLGAALAALHGVTHFMAEKFSLLSFRISLADLVLYMLAALAFASSIAWPNHIDPNDDLICYLMLPEKLLCTGTLIEPFSFQRAGTYGGQAILQALVMIVGAERNGHVPDRGIAMVMMFGMLVHATRGLRGQQAIVRFPIALCILVCARAANQHQRSDDRRMLDPRDAGNDATRICRKHPALVAVCPGRFVARRCVQHPPDLHGHGGLHFGGACRARTLDRPPQQIHFDECHHAFPDHRSHRAGHFDSVHGHALRIQRHANGATHQRLCEQGLPNLFV